MPPRFLVVSSRITTFEEALAEMEGDDKDDALDWRDMLETVGEAIEVLRPTITNMRCTTVPPAPGIFHFHFQ